MAFDFSTLITDRSPQDLQALRDLLSTPLSDWTAEQLAEFNFAKSKGAYNYTDLNRVTQCMDYLNERLTEAGYVTGYQRIVVHPEVHPEPVGPLPDGYTELEYIESTGTQYIDTGVSAPNGFEAYLDITFTAPSSSIQCVIGAHEQAPPYYRNYLGINPNFGSWNIGCYNSGNFGTSAENVRYQIRVSTVHENIYCYLNGVNQNVPQNISADAGRSGRTLYILAMNYPDGLLPAHAIFRGGTITINGQIVRNFIPCKNPDGLIGVYDLINKKFYQNAGTGNFIAGPEIISPDPTPEPSLDPTTWYEEDVPTATQMARYLQNVTALRGALELPEDAAPVPADMDGLTLVEANNIESILDMIQEWITNMQYAWFYSGDLYSGEV